MVVYKGETMQRTQIYFEQDTLQELKTIAKSLNISVTKPLESFKEVEATEYVRSLRDRSRILTYNKKHYPMQDVVLY